MALGLAVSRGADAVEAALERWEREGLLPHELAGALKEEAREHAAGRAGRTARYALAATGAAVLLVAAGVLSDWLWPLLEPRARTLVLAVVGVAVHGTGVVVGQRARWGAASYLLQAAGLLVVLGAFVYSETAWADGTPGAVAVGLLALLTPLVAAPAAVLRRDPVLPAMHLALLLAFFTVFLDRATPLSAEAVIWTVDALLAVLVLLLLRELRGLEEGGDADWAIHAFVVALYGGFALVAVTASGPMELGERTALPLDAWLLILAALTLWGLHRAPPALQRGWYEQQLGLSVLLAIPLLLFTSAEVWDAPAEVSALLVGGLGAAGLAWSVRFGGRTTLPASCIAVLAAAWFYGVDRGGALGVVLALGASAAFLFWVSTRIGWGGGAAKSESAAGVDAGTAAS